MSINKILNPLEKILGREKRLLLKIKDGLDTDKIVNEFLANNKLKIKELNTLLRPKEIDLLNQVEQLSTCESKLINKIKDLNYLENGENHQMMTQKEIMPSNRFPHKRISSFMINWSNKFVVIDFTNNFSHSLSKQAWA